jgi:serine/threonine protein kinase
MRDDDRTVEPLTGAPMLGVHVGATSRSTPVPGRFAPGAIVAGRYRLVALLGRGGMGEVYRADDLTLDQPVALKFLPAGMASRAAAHEKGVLHRDLKPANVMLDGNGDVRVTDFGIATAAEDVGTEGAGTPQNMAPELLAGKAASARSDIYALGLTLFEVFTGKRAYEAMRATPCWLLARWRWRSRVL